MYNPLIVKSGQQDSNLRPPAPKAGALTGLRYTPNDISDRSLIYIIYAPSFKSDAKVYNDILSAKKKLGKNHLFSSLLT